MRAGVRLIRASLTAVVILIPCLVTATHAAGASTLRVNLGPGGEQANQHCDMPAISRDGRYVVFTSYADNLLPPGPISSVGLLVRDLWTGTMEPVGVNSQGQRADSSCDVPAISGDGRYVAFRSSSSNLVPGPTNWTLHIFVRDRVTGTNERVSVSSAGVLADQESDTPSISADGRVVAFPSTATTLVPGYTRYGWDVFAHDRVTGMTECVSVGPGGAEGDTDSGYRERPGISADGRYIAFSSGAGNLVPGGVRGYWQIYVRDRLAGVTEMISVGFDGQRANNSCMAPSMSADGRYVAFQSTATNLVQWPPAYGGIYVRDRLTRTTELASLASTGMPANSGSNACSISADGRYVAFTSWGSNLVPGDTNSTLDIFVRDRWKGQIERVSVGDGGQQADNVSDRASISAYGRFIAFSSSATNLVAGDTNAKADVFVRDRGAVVIGANFDQDDDVDLEDFSRFQTCFNGPNRPSRAPDCSTADSDADGDVDLGDFNVFHKCFNGPNRPPRCG